MGRTHTGDIIDHIHRTYGRFLPSREDARVVVLGTLDRIAARLAAGDDVELDHLGVIAVHEGSQPATLPNLDGTTRPNPRAGEKYRHVTLRDSESLSDRLNG